MNLAKIARIFTLLVVVLTLLLSNLLGVTTISAASTDNLLAEGFNSNVVIQPISLEAPANAAPGSGFWTNINITGATQLNGYQLRLLFDPAVIQMAGLDLSTGISSGVSDGLINGVACPIIGWTFRPTAGVPSGNVLINGHLFGISSASGSGYLAMVHFNVVGAAGTQTNLALADIDLSDSSGNDSFPVAPAPVTIAISSNPSLAAVVTTNPVSALTGTSATLNGSLTSLGSASTLNLSLAYSTLKGGPYISVSGPAATANTSLPLNFNANITGLTPGNQYFYVAEAQSGNLIFTGAEMTFVAGQVGNALKLSFSTQPGGAVAGAPLGPQPAVMILDALGNLVTGDNSTMITLAISGNSSGVLSGIKTLTATNGIASFSGLNINLAGSYMLSASSSPVLTAAVSSSFVVTSGGGSGGSSVNLALLPATQSAGVGSTFNLVVQAQCGNQTTDGIDIYLDFNPAYLAVQSAASGTALSTALMSPAWDNNLGTFGCSFGQLGGTLPSGNFTVVTLTFLAKKVTPVNTPVTFHTASPRTTMVDSGGNLITGALSNGIYYIFAEAPLCLSPASAGPFSGNQTFNMDIRTSVSPSQQVSGVQAYVNFDTSKLEVLQVTPGTSLTTVLQNTFTNNGTGLVSYSAGQLSAPFPTGNFTVATIQFKAKPVTSNTNTPVTFSLAGPSTTSMVDLGGTAIPGTHSDAAVQIIPGATVNLAMVLQGGSRPDTGWVVPLTVKFFTPGTDVMAGTPICSFNLTTAKNGSTAIAQVTGINPGTYDISAVSTTTLTNVKRAVVIAAPSTAVNLGTLLEGDANSSGAVNIQDFGLLASSYGKSTGVSGFDARADFDRNGTINIADFGLLSTNYGKFSPLEVP